MMETQLQIVNLLKEIRERPGRGTRGDAPEGDHLDGLRVTRDLNRMRQMRQDMEANPNRTTKEYKRHWVRQLGCEGRGFRWVDRRKAISWRKYTSLKRCD